MEQNRFYKIAVHYYAFGIDVSPATTASQLNWLGPSLVAIPLGACPGWCQTPAL